MLGVNRYKDKWDGQGRYSRQNKGPQICLHPDVTKVKLQMWLS